MSTPDEVAQIFKELVAEQLKQLYPIEIQQAKYSYLQDYHLGSIFQVLFHAHNSDPTIAYLNPHDVKKLTEYCIQVIDLQTLNAEPCSSDIWGSAIWALKIFVLIAQQPFVEPESRESLDMIYRSVIKHIQILSNLSWEMGYDRPGKELMLLAAYCLSQDNFKKVISPLDAYNLAKDSVFPVAVWCFHKESDDFADNILSTVNEIYHGRSSRDNTLLNEKCGHIYPLLVRLLLALAEHSESSQIEGESYIKQFNTMLNAAIESGKINDEHIVALNVTVAHWDSSPPSEHRNKLLMDLLNKSDGLQRAHIAYITWKNFQPTNVQMNDFRDTFAVEMIDDLITRNDDLLDTMASNSLLDMQNDGIDWYKLVTGKEVRIFRKLVEINSRPNILHMFLKRFDCFKDSESSMEFDRLSQIPISYAINTIHHVIKLESPDSLRRQKLRDCLRCLEQLLRLRRRRLEQDKELKFIEVFNLLTTNEFSNYHSSVYGILLVFANCYQVHHQIAWNSVINLIRYASQTLPIAPDQEFANNPKLIFAHHTVCMTLSYFLMTDAEYFWGELASLEELELIYNYCKSAVESPSLDNSLLKEMLLTWPKEFEKTKLSSDEYRTMMDKFIELLIRALKGAKENVSTSEGSGAHRSNRFINFLSGLVVAFIHHREFLHDVLGKLGHTREDQDSWLGDNLLNWTRLSIECDEKVLECSMDTNKRSLPRPNSFAEIVIAYEALKMITEGSHGYSELTKLSVALLGVVKLALGAMIEQVPIDSIESRRYQLMKADLPAA